MSANNPAIERVHPVVGRCIYCFTTEGLEDEHTVPYSLHGSLMLREGSCRTCADITSRFEGRVTRGTLEVARAVMQYNTRNPDRRRETYPAEVVINGQAQTVEMPVEAYAALVPLVDLGYPTYLIDKYSLDPEEYRRDRRHNISVTVSRDPAATRAFLESIGADSLHLTATFNAYEFIRMVAKIAYCEAIAQLMLNGYPGLESIEENFVLDFIRNGGSLRGSTSAACRRPHRLMIGRIPTTGMSRLGTATSSPTSNSSLNSAGLDTVWSSVAPRMNCASGCTAKDTRTPDARARR